MLIIYFISLIISKILSFRYQNYYCDLLLYFPHTQSSKSSVCFRLLAHLSSNRGTAILNSQDPEAECGLGGNPGTEHNQDKLEWVGEPCREGGRILTWGFRDLVLLFVLMLGVSSGCFLERVCLKTLPARTPCSHTSPVSPTCRGT